MEGDKTKQDRGMTVTTCVEAKICGLPVISAVIVSTDSALNVASTACLLQTSPFT
jgi:hypothetical protein